MAVILHLQTPYKAGYARIDQDLRSFVSGSETSYAEGASGRRGHFDLSRLTVRMPHRYHAPGETRAATPCKDVFSHT
jgi:hypothetical protein